MYTRHAEFKAGVVVLLAIAGLLALVYFAGGSEPFWGSFRYVPVRFEQGFVAPRVGDPVKMNGKQIGRVLSVEQREEVRGVGGERALTDEDRRRLGLSEDEEGTFRELYILAVVKMPSDQIVPEGTRAQIETSITGIRQFNLLPGYSTADLTDEEARRDPIPGTEAPSLGDISGRIDTLAERIGTLAIQGGEVLLEARDLIELLKNKIDVFDTEALDREARGALGALRRTLEGLEGRVDTIATNLEEASGDIRTMADEGSGAAKAVREDVKALMTAAQEVVRKLDRIVAEARGPIGRFLADMERAGQGFARASEEVSGLAEQFAGIGPEARSILANLGVDLDTLVGRLNDTAHNLLDTSEDIRAHPWKLLNEPDEKEIAYENLRAAAMSYMRAMRDVNESSRRLMGILQRDDLERPEVRRLLEAAVAEFEAAQARYRADEARWQQMFQSARGGR